MSSEKYELAQDELDSLMEKIGADVRKTEISSGEAKKRMVQVRDQISDLMTKFSSAPV